MPATIKQQVIYLSLITHTKFGLRLGYACKGVRHKHKSFAHGHHLFRSSLRKSGEARALVP